MPFHLDSGFWMLDIRKQSIIYNLSSKIRRSRRPGFTLIELLVVITLIGILIAVGTVSYTNAQKKGRDGRRKTDLKSLQQALELYFHTNGIYPGWTSPTPGAWCAVIRHNTYHEVSGALEPTYISKIPQDPLYPVVVGTNGRDYVYSQGSLGKTYELYSILENSKDPDYATYNPILNSSGGACTAGSYPYNFKVTNP